MGGMSYECPLCKGWWTMSPRSLKDHLRGKHGLKNLHIEGYGSGVKIREGRWVPRNSVEVFEAKEVSANDSQ